MYEIDKENRQKDFVKMVTERQEKIYSAID